MKSLNSERRTGKRAFTLVEIMIAMVIVGLTMGMVMETFTLGLRIMFRDNQRLLTAASLRSFMGQLSKETLDASTFYLFPYYTSIDSSVNLDTDPVAPTGPEIDAAGDDFDKWIGHGDCLVLVTKTSQHRTTDIRQIRIYYRVTTNQAGVNSDAAIRYYETADWGEGGASTSNLHPFSGLAAELNAINLAANPARSGTRLIHDLTKGRKVSAPYTPYSAGDRYPAFSTESPTATPADGFVSVNLEFINGTGSTARSSSSLNYTISPRR